ncbi:MAG: helix-turn-helix domain-containing protein [Clostridia bacterium]|nr:helix-turn-helix domain-containing protein [Clostridia bacterium]
MNTAKRIAELRLLSGMSQAELAERLFVDRTLVSRWENGSRRPDAASVAAMAELFRVPAESIVSYDASLKAELKRVLPRDGTVSPEALPEMIGSFLRTLSEKDRNVFIRRYHHLEDLSAICERYGLSYAAVSMSLFRSRKKLRSFLGKEKAQ